MSDDATISLPYPSPAAPPAQTAPAINSKSFLGHAKLIGFFTLISRFLGLAREMVMGHYLGTGVAAIAFTVAFTIPNLFRKLFGEGALSAAFIPLYAQAVKHDSLSDANRFAAASVNLLCSILLGITIVGEIILFCWIGLAADMRPDRLLTLKLTAIMLPYVLLICGGAFLSGILQVHRRFAAPAAAPIILNICHIGVVLVGAKLLHLHARGAAGEVEPLQIKLAYALAFFVLVAGVLQVAILLPALRLVGFRFIPSLSFWTPAIKRMLWLSLPVALGAGVLQLSVLLDKGIAIALMQSADKAGNLVKHFQLFGHSIRYPMEMGAPRRLDLAQFLYQFPLGVFATALATAIFPGLSADALDKDREKFRTVLRHGIEATIWEGLPASIGLIMLREPAIRLLFQHGQITANDADLIGRSVLFYAGAIWAFSLLQILNRAYYAIHDTVTPLVMAIVNIALNLIIEIPLLWWLGEPAMAVGTLVSFAIQAIVMLFMIERRIGDLNLAKIVTPGLKMLAATALMAGALWAIKISPLYPRGESRWVWATQLTLLLSLGAGVYLGTCALLKIDMISQLLPRRKRT